jgi:trk system potassium uptake protein TrkH
MIETISRKISSKLGDLRKLHTTQIILLSFSSAIAIGTLLLSLQISSTKEPLAFIDALFTATSAVCVTGLVVVDTATHLTRFGQTVVLVLIQLGGLGIMTFGIVFTIIMGGRLKVKDRMVVQDTLSHLPIKNINHLIKSVFLTTFTIELFGFFLLFMHWLKYFPAEEAAYNALFHSVSAFCNAGFSTFSNSLESFSGDILTNLIIMGLIILGGLGFLVHTELRSYVSRRIGRRQISLNTKMTVAFSFALIVIGMVFIFFMESGNLLHDAGFKEKMLSSLFQSVTTRTAGFNTISTRGLTNSVLFLMIFFMFIGASSGSTGGGTKVNTFAVLFALCKSRFSGEYRVSMFRRTIPSETIKKCLIIFVASIFVVLFFVVALSISEAHQVNNVGTRGMFYELVFEVVSAFGTVGLSAGYTPHLTKVGRILITCLMLIGRVGPLTIALAIGKKEAKGVYKYAEENIMVG